MRLQTPLLLLFASVCAPLRAVPPLPAPDLILKNGAIYTVDAARSWADALDIVNGRIDFAGPDSSPLALAGPHTHIVDLRGRIAPPGLNDSHVHLNLNLRHTSAAIARRGVYESEGPARIQREKLSLSTRIATFTDAGVWVNREHEEKATGSLEPGKASHLIGCGQNRFAARPEKSHQTKVLLAILDGKPIYSDATLLPSK